MDPTEETLNIVFHSTVLWILLRLYLPMYDQAKLNLSCLKQYHSIVEYLQLVMIYYFIQSKYFSTKKAVKSSIFQTVL